MQKKDTLRKRRHARIRAKLSGTAERPRLVVHRSLNTIYAQLIDDEQSITLIGTSDLKVKKGSSMERAKQVGTELAQKALEKKIETCIFDRNGYKYHGRVKVLAEAAREAGLKF